MNLLGLLRSTKEIPSFHLTAVGNLIENLLFFGSLAIYIFFSLPIRLGASGRIGNKKLSPKIVELPSLSGEVERL